MNTNFKQSSAYELAEQAEGLAYEIPADWSSGEPKNVATDIANMLRQQADRIAELEKQLQESAMNCISAYAQADDHYAMVQELKKQLAQQQDFIADWEKQSEPVAWMEYIQDEEWEVWFVEPTDLPKGHTYKPLYLAPQTKPLSEDDYKKTHEGFSTIQEVIAKHEAIPSRKEAIDKAREWLKNYPVEAIFVEPFAKPLSDEPSVKEITDLWLDVVNNRPANDKRPIEWHFARAIEAKVRGEK